MFEGQPKGLYALALANTGERFGYYTMLAVFALFLRANFGLEAGTAGAIYSTFLGLVYFLPLIGGLMADKFGFGKMVTIGILIMFGGYLLLSLPLGGDSIALVVMLAALVLIGFGTGSFKGNLQVMVGDLYNEAKFADKRDSGFSIFYMAINIGALFAPTAAVKIMEWAQTDLGYSVNDSYHFAFAVACASLILSIAIYYATRSTFRHVEGGTKKTGSETVVEDLPKEENKARIVALCLVYAVVIFFWMAFHQNGLTLTYFADEFTAKTSEGVQSMAFDVWNLVLIIIAIYTAFSFFQSQSTKNKVISVSLFSIITIFLTTKALLLGGVINQFKFFDNIGSLIEPLGADWDTMEKIMNLFGVLDGPQTVSAPIFQQFNPFYVVALTPVSLAIFGALASKGKEPSAPRKIAYGMLVAAAGFAVMAFGSFGLLTPDAQKAAGESATFVSANWLISTYLVLTFAELLLSPMGISFVSKVAPPKLKGMMMGGWFVATAIGNMLVSVGGFLWGNIPLWIVWTVFISLCVISAIFMFAMMKRLEKVAK
jgi:POT family proton-dependent oligopeptide transporter